MNKIKKNKKIKKNSLEARCKQLEDSRKLRECLSKLYEDVVLKQ